MVGGSKSAKGGSISASGFGPGGPNPRGVQIRCDTGGGGLLIYVRSDIHFVKVKYLKGITPWAAWKQLFLECVNKHAPLHVKRARVSKSPWITPYLKKRMHDRDILKLKASRSKDANDWLQFKKCRNLVNNEIKKAKELFYKRALDENEGLTYRHQRSQFSLRFS